MEWNENQFCVVHGDVLHLLGAQLHNTQPLDLYGITEHPTDGIWSHTTHTFGFLWSPIHFGNSSEGL